MENKKKLTNAANNVFKITESLSGEASFYISRKLNDTKTEIPSVFFFYISTTSIV